MKISTDIAFYILRIEEWESKNPSGYISYETAKSILNKLLQIALENESK